jgi:hypothetical protein
LPHERSARRWSMDCRASVDAGLCFRRERRTAGPECRKGEVPPPGPHHRPELR